MFGILFGRNPAVAAISAIAGVVLIVVGLEDKQHHMLAALGGVLLVVSIVRFATRRGRQ